MDHSYISMFPFGGGFISGCVWTSVVGGFCNAFCQQIPQNIFEFLSIKTERVNI